MPAQCPSSSWPQISPTRVLESLLDLFVNNLLPRDSKLVLLNDRLLHLYKGTDRTLSLQVLLLWWYKEMIKVWYSLYLAWYLDRALASENKLLKRVALPTTSSLLVHVPKGKEQGGEANHDCVQDQLQLVLDKYPTMVNIVAREVSQGTTVWHFVIVWMGGAPCTRCPPANIAHLHRVPPHEFLPWQIQIQQLAHRPHLSPRVLYNCVVFLNQLQLSRDDHDNESNDLTGQG
jgi:ribosome biogenesis protein MAK21